MPFQVEQINQQPIILTTISRPFDFEADTRALHQTVSDVIDNIGEPVWSILDLSHMNLSFREVMIGMGMTTNDMAFGMDSRTGHLIFIGEDSMVTMAAIGLKQNQYGGISTHLFRTVEAAMAFIEAFEMAELIPVAS